MPFFLSLGRVLIGKNNQYWHILSTKTDNIVLPQSIRNRYLRFLNGFYEDRETIKEMLQKDIITPYIRTWISHSIIINSLGNFYGKLQITI